MPQRTRTTTTKTTATKPVLSKEAWLRSLNPWTRDLLDEWDYRWFDRHYRQPKHHD